MKWSFKVARVGGIDVRIHVTFFLLLVWIGWQNYTRGGTEAAIQGILFILALFFCVLLHEFGHAFAARAFGIATPDITLLPIGGVARLQRMPENPYQELIIAIAGPAMNIVIAGILLLVTGLPGNLRDFFSTIGAGGFFQQLMEVNIFLVLFNMIPAFPMDGGRVLRALLALFYPHAKATLVAARIGQGMAVLFAVGGFFGNPMLIFIAFFIFTAAQQENAYVQMRDAARHFRIGDIMLQKFRCLPESMPLEEVMVVTNSDIQPVYPVVDEGLGLCGLVGRENLLRASHERQRSTLLRDVMIKGGPRLAPEATPGEAMEIMRQEGYSTLPVVNPSGQIVGLVLASQLMNLAGFSKQH